MNHDTIRFIADSWPYLLAGPCIVTFLLFAWDKHLAHYQRTRVPEAVLFFFSFLMGAFGALCAMLFFRHKTKHLAFKVIVPLLAIIQIAALVYFKVYIQK